MVLTHPVYKLDSDKLSANVYLGRCGEMWTFWDILILFKSGTCIQSCIDMLLGTALLLNFGMLGSLLYWSI